MSTDIELHDAKILWDYLCQINTLERNNNTIIIGLGSYDLRVAHYCADLHLQGYGQKILFTGKSGNWTHERWTATEAEIFAEEAKNAGVLEANILLEQEATNIGENIRYSRKLIEKLDIQPEQIILVTKPNTTRRAYATFMMQWTDMAVALAAPNIQFNMLVEGQKIEDLINEMVGDIERIILYPAKGFQIMQEVYPHVLEAYERLRTAGYIKHCQSLVRPTSLPIT